MPTDKIFPTFAPFEVNLGKPPKMPAPASTEMSPEDRLLNRDLSWLAFNERVLSEAADPTVPPLERLRFACIVSSNLDEFFMVRVAEIARIGRRQPNFAFPDGMRAAQLLGQIREHALQQKARQATVLADILDALRREGIHIHADFETDRSLDLEIQERLPKMNLCLRRARDPMPSLWSERIHVFVRFPGEYAVITIEDREARLIELPASGNARHFALAERWLSARAPEIFPNREVIEAFPFKIIREADLRYRPEDEETLEEQIVSAVAQRKRAKTIRLEVDAPSYSEGSLFLSTLLGLDSASLYRFDLPLDLRALARAYVEKGLEALRYPPIQPQIPPPFRKTRSVFDTVKKSDILLHHPYDSFDIVVKFLEAAAADPNVKSISHTMYRTSRESPVMAALQEAARKGKKVKAYVEIKARFDELNNVRWAEELRKSGVKVFRPLGRFKVHSKLTQVVRTEDGEDVSYLHLGTGNYHPVTARQYTDLGLLTCDKTLGEEVTSYFSAIERGRTPSGFTELLVAPGDLHARCLKLIHEETQIQRQGGRGHIIAKMNSLVDPHLINALYEASAAGVTVELLVRGICCVVPGIKGLSENIRVVSVVDRFLEHSRIYYFRANGLDKLYVSSADWMSRNFFTRYEIAFPVKDASLKRYVRDVILGTGLADNVKAWALKPDGTYIRSVPADGAKEIRSQFQFEALAKVDYRDTALANR
ncbi:MAG: polyphosphate kinase 1 [Elusimicrobia bacterium]|nr:polyphosphate kinase 1 [Elusimicrobiota bacterium]